LEFLDKNQVCRRKIKLTKLFQRYPFKIIVIFRIDFPIFPIGTIGQKLDRDVIIVIPKSSVLNCVIVCLKNNKSFFRKVLTLYHKTYFDSLNKDRFKKKTTQF